VKGKRDRAKLNRDKTRAKSENKGDVGDIDKREPWLARLTSDMVFKMIRTDTTWQVW
jgi:hypothetical protein